MHRFSTYEHFHVLPFQIYLVTFDDNQSLFIEIFYQVEMSQLTFFKYYIEPCKLNLDLDVYSYVEEVILIH